MNKFVLTIAAVMTFVIAAENLSQLQSRFAALSQLQSRFAAPSQHQCAALNQLSLLAANQFLAVSQLPRNAVSLVGSEHVLHDAAAGRF